jgi:hypothetical protein
MKKVLVVLFVTLITACSNNNAIKHNEMTQIKNELKFDSLDQIQNLLKDLYGKEGMSGVKKWVTDNIKDGTKITFKTGPSGKSDEEAVICDRRMETLDKNGINIVDKQYLPFISKSINYDTCTLYFSLRVLFISEPFGIVIHKKTS